MKVITVCIPNPVKGYSEMIHRHVERYEINKELRYLYLIREGEISVAYNLDNIISYIVENEKE